MNNIEFDILKQIKKTSEKDISKSDISSFESKYNINLPKDYKDFLLKYNGGLVSGLYINNDSYSIMNNLSEKTSIKEFYPLQNIVIELEGDCVYCEDGFYTNKILSKHLIPFATDNVGWFQFFIGDEKLANGNIYVYDHQEDENQLTLLCSSFTEFMNAFYPKNDNE
ncbi:MAG: SMI1/KNR4 family protein [Candidatus Sericytochromatia bacterium]